MPGLPTFNTGGEASVYPVLGPRGACRLSPMYFGSLIASGAHSLAPFLLPASRLLYASQPAVNRKFRLKGHGTCTASLSKDVAMVGAKRPYSPARRFLPD